MSYTFSSYRWPSADGRLVPGLRSYRAAAASPMPSSHRQPSGQVAKSDSCGGTKISALTEPPPPRTQPALEAVSVQKVLFGVVARME